jgi:hypothetical protein
MIANEAREIIDLGLAVYDHGATVKVAFGPNRQPRKKPSQTLAPGSVEVPKLTTPKKTAKPTRIETQREDEVEEEERSGLRPR